MNEDVDRMEQEFRDRVAEEELRKQAMDKQYIIVSGNPVEGFTYFGPYPTRSDATDAALENFTDWWVAELFPPAHLEPEESVLDAGYDYGR